MILFRVLFANMHSDRKSGNGVGYLFKQTKQTNNLVRRRYLIQIVPSARFVLTVCCFSLTNKCSRTLFYKRYLNMIYSKSRTSSLR